MEWLELAEYALTYNQMLLLAIFLLAISYVITLQVQAHRFKLYLKSFVSPEWQKYTTQHYCPVNFLVAFVAH